MTSLFLNRFPQVFLWKTTDVLSTFPTEFSTEIYKKHPILKVYSLLYGCISIFSFHRLWKTFSPFYTVVNEKNGIFFQKYH